MARKHSDSGSTSAAGFEIYRSPHRRRTSKLVSLGFGGLFVAVAGVGFYAYSATDSLIQNVKEGNNLATFSAYVLALKGPIPQAREALLDGLKSSSPALRGACARACGKYKQDLMVAMLGELAVTDPVPTVRIAALDGLAHNGKTLGVHRYLLQVLQEEDDQEVLVAACETTAKLDADIRRMFSALLDLVQDHRGRVAGAAVRALESMTDMRWGNDVLAWKRWYGQEYGR
ncbi:MAG: HEAT repeat domain-containing protein [Planctomycetes bacterium]|nr:HEAT repeat domain-containing protein [Planctomycetota bacterium]